jgi:hypothetical protein
MMADLSLGLNYSLKRESLALFRRNVPLRERAKTKNGRGFSKKKK